MLHQYEDFKGAIKYATEALLKDSKNVKGLQRRGTCYMHLKRWVDALADFKAFTSLGTGENKEIAVQMREAATNLLVEAISAGRFVTDGQLKYLDSLFASGADIGKNG